jgi:hypothetical protein
VSAAFYCVSSELYFLGAVGMINSLRHVGHDEPIYVLDCGLTPEHRSLIEREATVVAAPPEIPPTLLKTFVPSQIPADVRILIDADMIATRRLDELIEAAAGGRVVAGGTGMDRFRPEWEELLSIGPMRPLPYVSSALVLLGGELGSEVLAIVDDKHQLVDYELSCWSRNVADYPLVHADQDLINAALCARAADDQVVVFDPRLSASPPFSELRLVEVDSLHCAYDDGTEPYVVHHWLAKPWVEETHHGVYSQLLRRLLIGDDVALKVGADELPLRFRRGPLAFAERKRINARERIRWRLGQSQAMRPGRR